MEGPLRGARACAVFALGALLALGACRSDEPSSAPASSPAAPAPGPVVPGDTGAVVSVPSVAAGKVDAPVVPAPDRKEVVAATFEELYCANRREEGADLIPIYDARGFESPSAFVREMDRLAAEDPEWARALIERTARDGCR